MTTLIEQSLAEWVRDASVRLKQVPDDAEGRARVVSRFLADQGIRSLNDLTAPKLMDWLTGLSETKARSTVRNRLAAIRQWSRFLHATGKIEHLPFESVKVAKCVGDNGCDPLTQHQAIRLIENTRRDMSANHHARRNSARSRLAAYLLMLDAGLRVKEVRCQSWSDIDFKRRVLTVTNDKAGRRDKVPLSPKTVAALRLLRIEMTRAGVSSDLVMHSGGPNAKTLRQDLDRVGCSGEAGRYHRLRKFAITERARLGWGMWELATFARHRDPKTTMRYVRLAPSDLPTVDVAAP